MMSGRLWVRMSPRKHRAKPEKHDVAGDNGRDELGRWKPGQSGNPAGRPPGLSLRSLIVDRLEECPEGLQDGRSLAEELVVRLVADAIKHDGQSRKILIEMLEGRPRQSVAVDTRPIVPIIDNIPRHEQYLDQAAAAIAEAERIAKKRAERDE